MPRPSAFTIRSTAITDIGRVRRQNEDRFLRSDATLLYAVADGIGGLPGGAQAAQAAIDALTSAAGRPPGVTAASAFVALVQDINRLVGELGARISPNVGIGTTLTCGTIRGDQLWLAHVGDSRCYLLRADRIESLTEDHSVENDFKRRAEHGTAPVDFVLTERNRQALTRCIGQPEHPEVDIVERTLAVGDRLLFVTDGVSRVVPEDDLLRLLDRDAPATLRLADLISTVNSRGGPDNATAVLIEIQPCSALDADPAPTDSDA